MTTTPKRSILELQANQDGVNTFNSSIRRLEQSSGFFNVINVALTTPPGSPADGDAYFIPTGATGAWVGQDNTLGYFENGAWQFIPVLIGDLIYSVAATGYYRYTSLGARPATVRDFSLSIKTPTASENRLIAFMAQPVEVLEVRSAVRGSSVSVTWNMEFNANRNSSPPTSTPINSANYTITGTQADASPTETNIPGGNWLWLVTSAASGTINDFWVTIKVLDVFL